MTLETEMTSENRFCRHVIRVEMLTLETALCTVRHALYVDGRQRDVHLHTSQDVYELLEGCLCALIMVELFSFLFQEFM
jgi:hypothetical protein